MTLDQVEKELTKAGLECQRNNKSITIQKGPISIWIQPVAYTASDRGNWAFNAWSDDPTRSTIDASDQFVRYYFDVECLIKEVVAWAKTRRMV